MEIPLPDFLAEHVREATPVRRVFTVSMIQYAVMAAIVNMVIQNPALMRWADETVTGATWCVFAISCVLLISSSSRPWSLVGFISFTGSLGVAASRLPSYYFVAQVWYAYWICACCFIITAAWASSTDVDLTKWHRHSLIILIVMGSLIHFESDDLKLPQLLHSIMSILVLPVFLVLMAGEIQRIAKREEDGNAHLEELKSAAILFMYMIMIFNLAIVTLFSEFRKV